MVFCQNCGKKIDEAALFCHFCGASQASSQEHVSIAADPPASQPTTPGSRFDQYGSPIQTPLPSEPPSFSVNPDATPSSSPETKVVYAGFLRRAFALLVDQLILSAPLAVITILVAGEIFDWKASGENSAVVGLIWWSLYLLIAPLYFALQEGSEQQGTVGKRLLGIKVTDTNGLRLSFGRALGRWFAASLSYLTLYIGFLLAGLTSKKQALHDMIAGTLVVDRYAFTNSPDLQKQGLSRRLITASAILGCKEVLPVFIAIVVPIYRDNVARSSGGDAIPSSATTQEAWRPPKFAEYPVDGIYGGPPAQLLLNNELARNYRTRFRESLSREPDFAGEYIRVDWGCGTSCIVQSFINKRTGRVLQGTFGGECGETVEDMRVNSRLLVTAGSVCDDNMNEIDYRVRFWVLEGERLQVVSEKSIPKPPEKHLSGSGPSKNHSTYMPLLQPAGKESLGRCHMGTCSWARYLSVNVVKSTPTEQNLLVTILGGYSEFEGSDELSTKEPNISWNDEPHLVEVTCSHSRPTIAMGNQIDELPLGPDGWPYILESGVNMYFAVCHSDFSSSDRVEKYGYNIRTTGE